MWGKNKIMTNCYLMFCRIYLVLVNRKVLRIEEMKHLTFALPPTQVRICAIKAEPIIVRFEIGSNCS